MKPKGREPLDERPTSTSPIDDMLTQIQEAVTRGYVVSQTTEDGQARLERLLVTMLAAMVNDPERPTTSEHRAGELADLLIRSIRAVNQRTDLT